jgi:hypothetical protein
MESPAGSRPGAAATGWVAGGRVGGSGDRMGVASGQPAGGGGGGGSRTAGGEGGRSVGWRRWWNRLEDHTIRGGGRRRTGQRKKPNRCGVLANRVRRWLGY